MSGKYRVDVDLAKRIRDLAPGDETELHRIAIELTNGACVPVMDTARLAHGVDPDQFPGMRQTAQAVRVAIAYGDLSGLLGCGYLPTAAGGAS